MDSGKASKTANGTNGWEIMWSGVNESGGFTLGRKEGRQESRSGGGGGCSVTVNYVAVCRKWCGTFGKMQFGLLSARRTTKCRKGC